MCVNFVHWATGKIITELKMSSCPQAAVMRLCNVCVVTLVQANLPAAHCIKEPPMPVHIRDPRPETARALVGVLPVL